MRASRSAVSCCSDARCRSKRLRCVSPQNSFGRPALLLRTTTLAQSGNRQATPSCWASRPRHSQRTGREDMGCVGSTFSILPNQARFAHPTWKKLSRYCNSSTWCHVDTSLKLTLFRRSLPGRNRRRVRTVLSGYPLRTVLFCSTVLARVLFVRSRRKARDCWRSRRASLTAPFGDCTLDEGNCYGQSCAYH